MSIYQIGNNDNCYRLMDSEFSHHNKLTNAQQFQIEEHQAYTFAHTLLLM